jgi:Cu2+-exporting ATPase
MTTLAFDGRADAPTIELGGFVTRDAAGLNRLTLRVDGIHCAGCIQRIENMLRAEPGIREARVNFTTRRLTLAWEGKTARAETLVARIADLGFSATPFEDAAAEIDAGAADRRLLRALAVAAFASGNVMLLSVAVWSGLAEGMGPSTRALMLWLSALIALPAIAYAGLPFFASAWRALRHRAVNMDVPISVGVLLTAFISLFETARGGQLAYFDAAVSLLFLLLVGRYLDRRARGRARSAAAHLLALAAKSATVLGTDGRAHRVPLGELVVGDRLLVAAGERIAADGTVEHGRSELDMSALSGESLPAAAAPATRVFAGTVNLIAPLTVRVGAVGPKTLLAEIVRLMETAEQGRARYVAIADRAARLYVPIVHGAAFATFVGWWLTGLTWQVALLNAVAVLIVTCPCALGIAVPAVQVVASGRLFRRGVLLKNATALERLAEIDCVVFDKTGTLTRGRPALVDDADRSVDALALAAGIARSSRHPLARALVRAAPEAPAIAGVTEHAGQGLAATVDGRDIRLGSAAWCGADDARDAAAADETEIWLRRDGQAPLRFGFRDALRHDAHATIETLKRAGYRIVLLSGDREPVVRAIARQLDIAEWSARCLPAEKLARLVALGAAGHRVLMVGDGLNDAPALAGAHASMSPASAADVSQTAADAVFQGDALAPVLETLRTARRARRLVRQNFAFSILYNAVTVPLAIAGTMTPLLAALAMSASSLTVVGNALRLQERARSAR